MARLFKANELKTGHYTKEQQVKQELIEQELKQDEVELRCPSWVKDKVAKAEFKRLSKELKEIGIISTLDLNSLTSYCIAYSKYRQAVEEMNGQPLTVPYFNKNGTSTIVPNPLIKIQKMYSDEMKKWASCLGLTIDSRLKCATLKVEKAQDEVGDSFGDI